MKDEEVLTEAFTKVMGNGYKPKYPVASWFSDKFKYQGTLDYKDYYVLIFSHEFARAFFGEGRMCKNCHIDEEIEYMWYQCSSRQHEPVEKWRWFLEILVGYTDPLEYIRMWLEWHPSIVPKNKA